MSIAPGMLILLLALPVGLPAQAPPAWVQGQGTDADSYPATRFLTGYGLSSPGGTEVEQRRQAVAMAKDALVSAIRTHVSSDLSVRVTQQDKHMSHYAQNLVRTHADMELEGLDTVLTWQDARKNTTHALAVLDKPRTLLLLDGQLQRQARECASQFQAARAAGDASGLIRARHIREHMEEQQLIYAVLSGGPAPATGPGAAEITAELRRIYAGRKTLDGCAAMAALDLGSDLPKGIRMLMDRITFADTPFCGSLSAYLEQALAGQLAAFGQVRILDKTQARGAIQETSLDGNLADALGSQAAVRGVLFDLGSEVKLNLRVTSATGEELATAAVAMPAQLVRNAGLKLVPDNYQEARKALEICDARVQSSTLQVKLAMDRGDGGIYRKGDKLHLFLKANLDCYVKVLYHQVDGTKVLVFPNRFHPDARIQKDRMYQIPPDDNSFDLVVQAPFGAELVKLIASTDPIDVEGKDPDANGLTVVRDDLAKLLGRTRGIALTKAATQYSEATAVVNTMDSGK